MPDKISRTIYVRPDSTAVISCNQCGHSKNVPVGTYKGSKNRLKIKCKCSNIFTVILEFRKNFRKVTNLLGECTNHSQKNIRGNIIVKNLSITGLKFISQGTGKFRNGDEITLLFRLDDTNRTMIKREATVRGVDKNNVRCEFEKSSEYALDGELGFYFM